MHTRTFINNKQMHLFYEKNSVYIYNVTLTFNQVR